MHNAFTINILFWLFTLGYGFFENHLQFDILEGSPIGTEIGRVELNQNFHFRQSGKCEYANYNTTTGIIRSSVIIDRERLPFPDASFNLLLVAQPAAIVSVDINVLDVNDNDPVFQSEFMNYSISESASIGSIINLHPATDPDYGENGTISDYFIQSTETTFKLNRVVDKSGIDILQLELMESVDRETKDIYILRLSAKDGGKPPRTGYTTVFISVLDVNDNPPVFLQNNYSFEYRLPPDLERPIGTITAIDADLQENAKVSYRIRNDPENQFRIDNERGTLYANTQHLNCSQMQCKDVCYKVCPLITEAEDNGNPKLSSRTLVEVRLLETNDHSPEISIRSFPSTIAFASVDSKTPIGSTVAVITAKDVDYGQKVKLELIAGNSESFFRFENGNSFGILRLNRPIVNYQGSFKLRFQATDDGVPSKSTEKELEVYFLEHNDEAPLLVSETLYADVYQNTPKDWFVTAIQLKNTSLLHSFQIINPNQYDMFHVGNHSGIITTARSLKSITTDEIELRISVMNTRPSIKVAKCRIIIHVIPINEHHPQFEKNFYKFHINEDAILLTKIGQVRATDKDKGPNGDVTYKILGDEASNVFSIKNNTGELILRRPLDREKQHQYVFEVMATDKGMPIKENVTTVIINVKDVNDNSPHFLQTDYYASVWRNVMPQTSIGRVEAYDPDGGMLGKVFYKLLEAPSGVLDINSKTGVITTASHLNTYAADSIKAIIGAIDGGGVLSTNNATFNIQLVQRNSDIPKFLERNWNVTVQENMPIKTSIGIFVATAEGGVRYGLSNRDLLEIDTKTGEIFTRTVFDREELSQVAFSVFAFGKFGTAMKEGILFVDDVNDNAPVFDRGNSMMIKFNPNCGIGCEIVKVTAKDSDKGVNGQVNYSLDSAFFSIGSNDGVIRYQKLLENLDQVQFTVVAKDNGHPALQSFMHITVAIESDATVPKFPSSLIFTVAENIPPGTIIDSLMPTNSKRIIHFDSKLPEPRNYPIQVLVSGEIVVAEPVDRERIDAIVIPVDAITQIDHGSTRQTIVVTIYITDVNDNAPKCPEHSIFYTHENREPLTVVGIFAATDEDDSVNASLEYQLLEKSDIFVIHKTHGAIQTLKPLDYETTPLHKLTVGVTDGGGQKTSCNVEIRVIDENDNPPIFQQQYFHFQANSQNNFVGVVSATDNDSGENRELRYRFKQKKIPFEVNEKSGEIFYSGKLQTNFLYNLTIIAFNVADPLIQTETFVFIKAEAIDHCQPKFSSRSPKQLEVSENFPIGKALGKVFATACQDQVIYRLAENNYNSSFTVDPLDGYIILTRSLDYEEAKFHVLTVNASTSFFMTLFFVNITVTDENDNDPIIVTNSIHIQENNDPLTFCGQFSTFDADSGENGRVKLEIEYIIPNSDSFRVEDNNLFCADSLDRENISSYKIFLKAFDYGVPKRTTSKMVTVVVDDENDNVPECKGGEAFLIGSEARTVTLDCVDVDSKLNGTVGIYSISAPGGITMLKNNSIRIESFLVEPREFTAIIFDRSLPGIKVTLETDKLRQTATRYFTVIPQKPSDNVAFEKAEKEFIVDENVLVGNIVGRLQVRSILPVNFYLTDFKNSHGSTVSWIKIDKKSGTLRLVKAPNDDEAFLEVTALAGQFTATETFKIRVENRETVFADLEEFYAFEVAEGSPSGSYVGVIGSKNVISAARTYQIRNSEVSSYFRVEESTGMVSTAVELDYEKTRGLYLIVDVTDRRSKLQKAILLQINVIDLNDNAPIFEQSEVIAAIKENSEAGSLVGVLKASDLDSGDNAIFKYKLVDAPSFVMVDQNTGFLYLVGDVDREEKNLYVFKAQAVDNGGLSSLATVYLFIGDDNDNPPSFKQQSYSAEVPENTEVGSTLIHLEVEDEDSDSNFWFEIETIGNEKRLFEIDRDGNLYLLHNLDRETDEVHILHITVYDQRPPNKVHSTSTLVQIRVTDTNDNSPTFLTPTTIYVFEEVPLGTVVASIQASDPDSGINGELEYRILPESHPSGLFIIDPVFGDLQVNGRLDREEKSKHNFIIRATDFGTPRLSAELNLTVVIIDIDDNEPVFKPYYEAKIAENTPIGHNILQIAFEDFDEEQNRANIFEIEDDKAAGWFEMLKSGFLIIKRNLNAHLVSSYQFNISARSSLIAEKSLIFIKIDVITVNDEPPKFVYGDYVAFTVYEGDVGTYPIKIGNLLAESRELTKNGSILYAIISGDMNRFTINDQTGALFLNQPLDKETEEVYELKVQATNLGSPRLTSEISVMIFVGGINDNTPKFSMPIYQAKVKENFPMGTSVIQVQASDKDVQERNTQLRYFLMDESYVPFEIDFYTGWVRTKTSLDREEQSHWDLEIFVEDDDLLVKKSARASLHVEILDENDNSPKFMNDALDVLIPNNLKKGAIVTVFPATDADDNDKLRYAISGADSKVLEIESNGVIRATASLVQKEYVIWISATDLSGKNSSAKLHLYTAPAEEFPVFAPGFKQRYSVEENAGNVQILTVSASTKKLLSGRIIYGLSGGSEHDDFYINSLTGEVCSSGIQDYERKKTSTLLISASTEQLPRFTSYSEVYIDLIDVNDNTPNFEKAVYKCEVLENIEDGLFVTQVQAHDADAGDNGKIRYGIIDDNMKKYFKIHPITGDIYTKTRFDAEIISHYVFEVIAMDSGNVVQRNSTARVEVTILDENDNAPKFLRLFQTSIEENVHPGSTVIKITSFDADRTSIITYEMEDDANGTFSINSTSGVIFLKSALDSEQMQSYTLKVRATDGLWQISTSVAVVVIDVDDNQPIFEKDSYFFAINSSKKVGDTIGAVSALDKDTGNNGRVFYTIHCPQDQMYIDPLNGIIKLAKPLIYNVNQAFRCSIKAFDNGILSLENKVWGTFAVSENEITPPKLHSDSLVHLLLYSNDKVSYIASLHSVGYHNFKVTYYLQDKEFFVSANGSLFTKRTFNQSDVDTVKKLIVLLSYEEIPYIIVQQEIAVKIIKNGIELPPAVKEKFSFEIAENSPKTTKVGKLLLKNHTEISEKIILYKFIEPNKTPFDILKDGTLILVGKVDFEETDLYEFNVCAYYEGRPNFCTKIRVLVKVLDENDNVPYFPMETIKVYVHENTPVGENIINATAIDLDSTKNAIIVYNFSSYSLIPFSINFTTGQIYTISRIDYEFSSSYRLEVRAMNPGNKNYSTLTVEINIESENEFSPKFASEEYQFEISWKAIEGSIVGKIDAVDRDDGRHGKVFYAVNADGVVKVLANGEILSGKKFTDIRKYNFLEVFALGSQVSTFDHHSPVRCLVKVKLLDYIPTPVLKSSYHFELNEGSSFSQKLVLIDVPLPSDSSVRIASDPNNQNPPFCAERDGSLKVCGLLDRESRALYDFQVFLMQGYAVRSRAQVRVTITDVNDNPPVLNPDSAIGFIRENSPSSFNILKLHPIDYDLLSEQQTEGFTFRISDEALAKVFTIDEANGVISSLAKFDRESRSQYNIPVLIADKSRPIRSAIHNVRIYIDDVSEFAPESSERALIIESTKSMLNKLDIKIAPLCRDEILNYHCSNMTTRDNRLLNLTEDCTLQLSHAAGALSEFSFTASKDRFSEAVTSFKVIRRDLSDDLIDSSVTVTVWGTERAVGDVFDLFQEAVPDMVVRIVGITRHSFDEFQLFIVVFDRNKNVLLNSDTKEMLMHFFGKKKDFLYLQVKEISANDCSFRNRCKNGATCLQTHRSSGKWLHLTSFKTVRVIPIVTRQLNCRCKQFTYGEHCEYKAESCFNDGICRNGGICDKDTGHCTCPAGYSGHDCQDDVNECLQKDLCKNGVCVNLPGSYRCICNDEYYGEHCDKLKCSGVGCTREKSLGFMVASYLEVRLLNPIKKLTFQFRTSLLNGLLLYSYGAGEDEFLVLEVIDGRLRFSYSSETTGYLSFLLTKKVDDGYWKKVTIKSSFQQVSLSVVDCDEYGNCGHCDQENCFQSLATRFIDLQAFNESILIGGTKEFDDIRRRPGQISAVDFLGCMRLIAIGDISLDQFETISDNNILSECPSNFQNCSNKETSEKCLGGKCIENVMGAVCVCENSFEAASCRNATNDWYLHNGEIRFELNEYVKRQQAFIPVPANAMFTVSSSDRSRREILRDVPCEEAVYEGGDRLGGIATQWMELDFRIADNNGMIFSIVEKSRTLNIKSENGLLKLVATNKGAKPVNVRLERPINDGKWHRLSIQISRNRKFIRFQCDSHGKDVHSAEEFPQMNSNQLRYLLIGRENYKHSYSMCVRRFIINNQAQPFEDTASMMFSRQYYKVVRATGLAKGCQESNLINATLQKHSAWRPFVIFALLGTLLVVTLVLYMLLKRIRVYMSLKQMKPKRTLSLFVLQKNAPRSNQGSSVLYPSSATSKAFPKSFQHSFTNGYMQRNESHAAKRENYLAENLQQHFRPLATIQPSAQLSRRDDLSNIMELRNAIRRSRTYFHNLAYPLSSSECSYEDPDEQTSAQQLREIKCSNSSNLNNERKQTVSSVTVGPIEHPSMDNIYEQARSHMFATQFHDSGLKASINLNRYLTYLSDDSKSSSSRNTNLYAAKVEDSVSAANVLPSDYGSKSSESSLCHSPTYV